MQLDYCVNMVCNPWCNDALAWTALCLADANGRHRAKGAEVAVAARHQIMR